MLTWVIDIFLFFPPFQHISLFRSSWLPSFDGPITMKSAFLIPFFFLQEALTAALAPAGADQSTPLPAAVAQLATTASSSEEGCVRAHEEAQRAEVRLGWAPPLRSPSICWIGSSSFVFFWEGGSIIGPPLFFIVLITNFILIFFPLKNSARRAISILHLSLCINERTNPRNLKFVV